MSDRQSIEELELTLGRVLRIGVTVSSIALAAGLATAFLEGTGTLARVLLNAGVVLLIATPVARVAMSTIGYARRRDWLFVVLTTIVLAELVASLIAAIRGRT